MEKKVKIGVFGCWRGGNIARCLKVAGAEIVAVCDKDPVMIDKIRPILTEDAGVYSDFDEFINHDMDGVVVANYYCEHTKYAIKLLEKGIHVLSECASNITMADGVALVRAAEASSAKYVLIENYPFTAACQELRRVYQSGKLGRSVFCEGEYVHPMSVSERKMYAPFPEHWRNYIPSTYYNTHSIGPLMYATEAMPLSVSAQSSARPEVMKGTDAQNDPFGLMVCKMDDGSIFSFSAWSQIGGHGTWYRIACTDGIVETMRYDSSRVRVIYNSFAVPSGTPKDTIYAPPFPYDAEKAAKCGHSGGDYYIAKEFVDVINGEREPFFNVYRATAMASIGILGWRSCLENGKSYLIPDFRREEDKKMYENDYLSPFVKADGTTDMPCSVEPKVQ